MSLRSPLPWLALCVALAVPSRAWADATLLVGEPYGRFGSLSPLGHSAVYLDGVCAELPTRVRRCEPGEMGVVVSRYGKIAGIDWMAIPLIPYLYAVDRAGDVPAFADRAEVGRLREAYRRAHLRGVLPDAPGGRPPRGDWFQLVGAAYDRRIVGFTVRTSPSQDDAIVRALNGRRNEPQFNLLLRNCADFARDVINAYYPGAVRNSVVADLGLTTPKQVGKSLTAYAWRHPELDLRVFAVERVPGSRPDGHGPRGVLESLVKTKKYLVLLVWVQPWVATGCAAGYLAGGRFDANRYVTSVYQPLDLEAWALKRDVHATD